jgi:hypothetical protein
MDNSTLVKEIRRFAEDVFGILKPTLELYSHLPWFVITNVITDGLLSKHDQCKSLISRLNQLQSTLDNIHLKVIHEYLIKVLHSLIFLRSNIPTLTKNDQDAQPTFDILTPLQALHKTSRFLISECASFLHIHVLPVTP